MNWDIPSDREKILQRKFPNNKLWCFDEIHKMTQWRDYLKGVYDEFHEKHQILVTGSARLDLFRKIGDSLQGRYFHLRLHPFSVAELEILKQSELDSLLKLGGFPEPFLGQSEREAKRWSTNYRSLLVNQEATSIETISDLSKLELLSLRLPELVSSPLSINALREDLNVSHKTVSRWLDILENIYMIFRVPPFGSPKIRAVKKEQKHYHYDWSLVQDKSKRYENLMASHLLKWVHYQRDVMGELMDLRYFRDTDGREVDFCIVKNLEPICFIECKYSDAKTSPHLKYLQKKFPKAEYYQISFKGSDDFIGENSIVHMPALKYLSTLV